MPKFKKNDSITISNNECKIIDLLGEGGQGTVYLINYNNTNMALKVYNDLVSRDFEYNLRNNINKGAPSSSFLWPRKIIHFDDDKIGYLMDLRPSNFSSFIKYLNGNIKFKNNI